MWKQQFLIGQPFSTQHCSMATPSMFNFWVAIFSSCLWFSYGLDVSLLFPWYFYKEQKLLCYEHQSGDGLCVIPEFLFFYHLSNYYFKMQLWDAGSGQGFTQFTEHRKRAWSVSFSEVDPTKLASGSDDCCVKVWSINQACYWNTSFCFFTETVFFESLFWTWVLYVTHLQYLG